MTNVTICVGSSCHLKGSKQVIKTFETLIKDGGLTDKVKLSGSFCMGLCIHDGVSVKIGDETYFVMPESAEEFFKTNVIGAMER